MNTDDAALMLWKEWFSHDGYPLIDQDGTTYCFFCSGDGVYQISENIWDVHHTNDCVYNRAKALVSRTDTYENTRLSRNNQSNKNHPKTT